MPATDVIAQFREDSGRGEVLLGLWKGILDNRWLNRDVTAEAFDPDHPTVATFGQHWWLWDPR